jgi:diguanylate cyclase (GGDEF)-like protein/PAS domain S-box-containing protein
MASRLDQLSSEEIEHIERSRARMATRAVSRELVTELSVCALFGLGVVALAVAFPRPGAGLLSVVWLVAIYAVLVRIEFEVGEGGTHPVQLVFVSMLVLLPPAVIPLAVVCGHLAATVPKVVRRRLPVQRLVVPVADSAFSLAPAFVIALLGRPDGLVGAAAVCLAALAALMVSDVAISSLRMQVGLGMDPRSELRGFAWVYLADLCLAPVGFAVAVAAAVHLSVVVAVLPLGALLAIFARERRGRIENALKLQRLALEARDRLQSIVQHSSDLIAIVDGDGTLRTITGSVEPIYGRDWQAAQGQPLVDRVDPRDVALVEAFLQSVSRKPIGEPQEAEWRMRYANGAYRHIAAVATNLTADPHVNGIVITARDVEDRKAFEEQLRHRAFHDGLTGLANRALFYDRIEQAMTRVTRAEGGQAAVLFVDLDDFKAINDAHGHAQCDQLLTEIARRLTSCLRAADTAARLGGDEFGVLVEGVADADGVAHTAARILDALARPIELADGPVSVSGSVGMAISTPQDRGVEELLRRADLAMYEAKRNGKGRAELYHKTLERSDGRDGRAPWFARNDEQRAEIEDVLADPDAITMVFQPIMDLRTGRVAGYESLSRFNRTPRRGPDVWFAQAHRCGLGYALEAKAITAALAAPGRPTGAYLTFNLSPSSLLSGEVLRVLPERLDGLVVEITENELVSGEPAILDALDALRARGARLAVDDTGAGYAGLTHLMRLQPDIIKLDRALTTGVDHDPAQGSLISSFVRYARDIDATVCAEGIETLADLHRLADLDVTYGQGYGIARPAAPWTTVDPAAAAACLRSFQTTLDQSIDAPGRADHDRRLELLAQRLASATTDTELDACLHPLAHELRADQAHLVTTPHGDGGATLVFADDPSADPLTIAELLARGFSSRLTLPITRGHEPLGSLELYRRDDRPWTRFEIGRARIISHQLAPLLPSGALTTTH